MAIEVVADPGAYQLASLRQWGTRFVHNLYSDGRPIAPENRWIDRPAYRALRQRIVSRHLEKPVITAIKLIHTAVFLVIMSFIVRFTYSGIRNQVSRRAVATLGLVAGEGVVLGVNGGQCPLTLVVEDLGSDHGEVADIFLPRWIAQHIAHVSTGLLGIGLVAIAYHRMCAK